MNTITVACNKCKKPLTLEFEENMFFSAAFVKSAVICECCALKLDEAEKRRRRKLAAASVSAAEKLRRAKAGRSDPYRDD